MNITTTHMILLVSTLLIAFTLYAIRRIVKAKPPSVPILDKAKLLYSDTPGSRIFASKTYKIFAKPDFIYRINRTTDAVVEFKSRESSVYPSDRSQVIASAIAARSKYPNIKLGIIILGNGKFEQINMDYPTDLLYQRIQKEAEMTRLIKSGQEIPDGISSPKCATCSVHSNC